MSDEANKTTEEKPDADTEHSQQRGRFLEGPIDIRSIALTGIFVIAAFHALYVAKSIFIPLVLAILLSLMLRPPVRILNKIGIPDSVGASIVLAILTFALLFGFYALSTPAARWLNEIPRSARKIEYQLRSFEKPLNKVKEVSDAVEDVASRDEFGVQKVKIRNDGILDYLMMQTHGFLMLVFLTFAFLFFLLASGDIFLRKLVRVIPKLQDKKQAVDIVHKIQNNIATYIFSISFINAGLGVAIATAMYFLGLPNPILWGAMAFLLNFVPYLGALTGVVVVGIVSIVEDRTIGYTLLVMLTYYSLTVTEGTLVTPMLVGHRLRLNPVVIFLALILWAWLWGIAGALLAVPILATFKILCDHLTPLKSIGEFIER